MEDSPSYEKDVESGKHPIISEEKQRSSEVKRGSVTPEAEVARARHIQNAWAPFRYMTKAEMWLDEKLGIETQGIDRIPEEEKRPPHIMNTFLMWWSMTCHVGTLPIGILGPIYGLNLHQSVACIIGGNFLGAMCTAYTGTLGPKAGSIPGLESDFADGSIQDRPPSNCYLSILIWFLRRKTLLGTQRDYQRGFRRRQCRGLRSDPFGCFRLYHDDRCGMCDCSRHLLPRLGLRLRHHPHVREIFMDHELYPDVHLGRTSHTSYYSQCSTL